MKKIYLFLLAIISSFLLNSCQQPKEEVNKEAVLSNIKIMLATDDVATSITKDFTVTLVVFETYNISWESDNEAISINSNNAIVARATADIAVVLTASFTFDGEECQKLFNLIVLKQDDTGPTGPTIEEVKTEY